MVAICGPDIGELTRLALTGKQVPWLPCFRKYCTAVGYGNDATEQAGLRFFIIR